MDNVHIIIPARFESSRFPGKPLKKILGKEMIIRVAEICKKVIGSKNLHIATDNKKIFQLVRKKNFNSILTPKSCQTGTDRIAYASKKIKSNIILNVQGDEPMIDPQDLSNLIDFHLKSSFDLDLDEKLEFSKLL